MSFHNTASLIISYSSVDFVYVFEWLSPLSRLCHFQQNQNNLLEYFCEWDGTSSQYSIEKNRNKILKLIYKAVIGALPVIFAIFEWIKNRLPLILIGYRNFIRYAHIWLVTNITIPMAQMGITFLQLHVWFPRSAMTFPL